MRFSRRSEPANGRPCSPGIWGVTSHGPVNAKRMGELKKLLASAEPGLVFVTAFPDRRTFLRFFGEVAWETEVWIAESSGHLVHFDGERLLGPYGGDGL